MGTILAALTGLVIWIVLWAINVKAIDSFLITIALVLGGVLVRLATPYVRELLRP
jgi:hypothetical protein